MKRFITPMIALALAAAPATVDAQTPQRGTPAARGMMGNPAERILSLREELGLTAQQVLQIQRIGGQLQEQNRAVREQVMQNRAAAGRQPRVDAEQRARMQERMRQRRDSIQALSPEQRTAMRDEMRARMEQRRDSMRALTPEQRAARRDEMRARMEQRRDSIGGRPGMMRRPAMRVLRNPELRAAMTQLRANTRSAVEQIQATLTDAQRAKLQELRPRAGAMQGRRPGVRR